MANCDCFLTIPGSGVTNVDNAGTAILEISGTPVRGLISVTNNGPSALELIPSGLGALIGGQLSLVIEAGASIITNFINTLSLTARSVNLGENAKFCYEFEITESSQPILRMSSACAFIEATDVETNIVNIEGTPVRGLISIINSGPSDAEFAVTGPGARIGGQTSITVVSGTSLTTNFIDTQTLSVRAITLGETAQIRYQIELTECISPGAIIITSQPQATTICATGVATFTVVATGADNLIYQWQVSTDGGVTFTNLINAPPYSGVNTKTLTITNTPLSFNNFIYRVIVSTECTQPVISNNALLTVIDCGCVTPVIVTQPVNQIVPSRGTAHFEVVATGADLTYQWQVSTDGGKTFVNINNEPPYSGANSPRLTITDVRRSLNDNRYRVIVTSEELCPITSRFALLEICTPPVITDPPVPAITIVGGTAHYNVRATGTDLTYQWRESTDRQQTFHDVPNEPPYSGANTPHLTITDMPRSFSGYFYEVVVTSEGLCSVTSDPVLNIVCPLHIITQQPLDARICEGETAQFFVSVANNIGPVTYQWQVSTNGGATFFNLTNTPPYSGVTTDNLVINGVFAEFDSNQYRVIVNSLCGTVFSRSALLNVLGIQILNGEIEYELGTTKGIFYSGDGIFQIPVNSSQTIFYLCNQANLRPRFRIARLTVTVTNNSADDICSRNNPDVLLFIVLYLNGSPIDLDCNPDGIPVGPGESKTLISSERFDEIRVEARGIPSTQDFQTGSYFIATKLCNIVC